MNPKSENAPGLVQWDFDNGPCVGLLAWLPILRAVSGSLILAARADPGSVLLVVRYVPRYLGTYEIVLVYHASSYMNYIRDLMLSILTQRLDSKLFLSSNRWTISFLPNDSCRLQVIKFTPRGFVACRPRPSVEFAKRINFHDSSQIISQEFGRSTRTWLSTTRNGQGYK